MCPTPYEPFACASASLFSPWRQGCNWTSLGGPSSTMSSTVRLPACHVGFPPLLLPVGGGGFGPGPAGGPAHGSRWRRWWRLALDGRAPPLRPRQPRASRRGGPVPRHPRPPPSGPPRAPPPPCRRRLYPDGRRHRVPPVPAFFFCSFLRLAWWCGDRPPHPASWSWSVPLLVVRATAPPGGAGDGGHAAGRLPAAPRPPAGPGWPLAAPFEPAATASTRRSPSSAGCSSAGG